MSPELRQLLEDVKAHIEQVILETELGKHDKDAVAEWQLPGLRARIVDALAVEWVSIPNESGDWYAKHTSGHVADVLVMSWVTLKSRLPGIPSPYPRVCLFQDRWHDVDWMIVNGWTLWNRKK